MRRLATQNRDDTYASRRDYQQLEPRVSVALVPEGAGPFSVAFDGLKVVGHSDFVCAGGYIRSQGETELTLTVSSGQNSVGRLYKVGTDWKRVGVATSYEPEDQTHVVLEWSQNPIEVWGFSAGEIEHTGPLAGTGASLEHLNSDHLVPETYYLSHDEAIGLSFGDHLATPVRLEDGKEIMVKKCSYCSRWLPVDLNRPGGLSFHKHSAKISGHQNECRACKKWRINDSFNPIRTTDQLHESSVITRERKVLLREPEILQALKDRNTGKGLKSQVWERFGKKCFRCGDPLSLDEVRLDHTRPLAYLWPLDEHATCLCEKHNGEKSDKFPVDYYTEEELRDLAGITGLPLESLKERSVNEDQLALIVADLPTFARQWDPRLFASTARRVKSLNSEIDLWELLREESPETADWLDRRLAERPDSVL